MQRLAKWFDSIETEKPFDSCKICQNFLSETGGNWVINKHYHRKECVLEYAICVHCRDEVSNSFSHDSKAAIRDFLETKIDWQERILEWSKLDRPINRLDHCVACTMPRECMLGFTISAQFRNDGSLIEGALPLLLCSHCISQITESLSPQSRNTWNQFITMYFEGPDSKDYHPGIF
ncbi:MAG: hypothetical protein ACK5JP_12655 [Akkermansiaceae bacterium]|jgi:hypothetical protein